LSAALTAARVRAASGNSSETNESLRRLDRVITDASTTRFEGLVLEARLAKGEIEMASADRSAGRAYLEALQKDAAKEGFQLIVQKRLLLCRRARTGLHMGLGTKRLTGLSPTSQQSLRAGALACTATCLDSANSPWGMSKGKARSINIIWGAAEMTREHLDRAGVRSGDCLSR